jgi:transcriptional regulator with XRE-family HTH domain
VLTESTDAEVMQFLGQRLRALRKARGMSAVAAAREAGLSRRTIYSAEQGDNPTLATLVRLLRLYGRLDALSAFVPEPEISPMALLSRRKGRGG